MFRIFVGAALLLAVVGCTTASRKANDQMEMRISQLENMLEEKDSEIRSLESQLEEARRVRVRQPVVTEKPDISKASKKDIQTALKSAGYYDGPIDGKFGQKTSTAITEFQKANGLKQDGKVGPQTWLKLSEYLE